MGVNFNRTAHGHTDQGSGNSDASLLLASIQLTSLTSRLRFETSWGGLAI